MHLLQSIIAAGVGAGAENGLAGESLGCLGLLCEACMPGISMQSGLVTLAVI